MAHPNEELVRRGCDAFTNGDVADDWHTVGLQLATGQREGRTLEDREVLVFRLRDGKVVEVWQYLENQYAYDEFFS